MTCAGLLKRGQHLFSDDPVCADCVHVVAKVSAFNEEQMRIWHAETGKGPADHSLLQPDPEYGGFQHLTPHEADSIDQENLARLLGENEDVSAA